MITLDDYIFIRTSKLSKTCPWTVSLNRSFSVLYDLDLFIVHSVHESNFSFMSCFVYVQLFYWLYLEHLIPRHYNNILFDHLKVPAVFDELISDISLPSLHWTHLHMKEKNIDDNENNFCNFAKNNWKAFG